MCHVGPHEGAKGLVDGVPQQFHSKLISSIVQQVGEDFCPMSQFFGNESALLLENRNEHWCPHFLAG